MSLGVGQLLLGGIFGGLLGNKEEQQQPTQVASNNQPQGGGGFMSNISNSLFAGMSQEQVYRMGQGFNTLRFEPDDNLHASFESRIKKLQDQSSLSDKQNETVAHLLGMVSDKYPNGRVDLAEMVKNGIMSPTDALSLAMKVKEPSAFAEKMQWLQDNPDATAEEKQMLGITQTTPSAFMEKMNWFRDNPNATDAELAAAGITQATEAVFLQKLEWLNDNPDATAEQLAAAGIVLPVEEKLSSFAEKMQWLEDNPDASDDEKQMLGITKTDDAVFEKKLAWLKENPEATDEQLAALGIAMPGQSLFMEKMQWLSDNPNANANQLALIGIATTPASFEKKLTWLKNNPEATDGELQVLGISNPAEYKQKMADLKVRLDSGAITQEEFDEGSYKLLTGIVADDGQTDKFRTLKLIAKEIGLVEGSQEWMDFFETNASGEGVSIDLGDKSESTYVVEMMKNYATKNTEIFEEVDSALVQIEKLNGLMSLLESGDLKEGTPAFTGIFQPLLTQMARIVSSLNKDATVTYDQLTKTEILKVMTGSDVFPMINTLGIGARGLDTPAERDFLISVMTGLPNMTIDTLKYLTQYRLDTYLDGLRKYNEKIDSGYFDTHAKHFGEVPRYDVESMMRVPTKDKGWSQEEIDLIMRYSGG